MADDQAPGPSDAPAVTGPWARLVESGYAVWVAVGAALLIALVVILVGGRDDPPAPTTDASGTTATPDTASGSDSNSTTEPVDDCEDFSLGANLLGVPGVASEPGVHVWHDVEGFHVRRVPGGNVPDVVAGTITPTGPELVLISPGEPAATASGGSVSFRLSDDTDEVLFKAPCSTAKVTFDLTSDDAPIAADLVTVGRGETPPDVPFTLERGGA